VGSVASRYQTKELSAATWPDFEMLFSGGNGWDHCSCMFFQRAIQPSRQQYPTRAVLQARNHHDKNELLREGRAHGILVYADGEPVGWCQFGLRDEFPWLDRRQATDSFPSGSPRPLWRITCFVVDKRYRRNGIAGVALQAALEAIGNSGGGVVEGYPVAGWTHGREASPGAVPVPGLGTVEPAHGSFGNVSTTGTVSMFEKAGFRPVGLSGRCWVQMRRTVEPRRS